MCTVHLYNGTVIHIQVLKKDRVRHKGVYSGSHAFSRISVNSRRKVVLNDELTKLIINCDFWNVNKTYFLNLPLYIVPTYRKQISDNVEFMPD